MSLPVLALYEGSVPNYGCPPIWGRVPGLPIVLPGWGDPCGNFLGSGAVVFWGIWVRCGRVQLVSSSFGSVWWSVPNYGCPLISRVPVLPIVLPVWGYTGANFLGSGGVVFCGFWVRYGRVKLVSSSFGSVWGSVPNYGCPPISGRVPGLSIV